MYDTYPTGELRETVYKHMDSLLHYPSPSLYKFRVSKSLNIHKHNKNILNKKAKLPGNKANILTMTTS